MKKKHLFLLLAVLWFVNAGIGGFLLYRDFSKMASVASDPAMLSHLLYMIAAVIAAVLVLWQYFRCRKEE